MLGLYDQVFNRTIIQLDDFRGIVQSQTRCIVEWAKFIFASAGHEITIAAVEGHCPAHLNLSSEPCLASGKTSSGLSREPKRYCR
jgi:hypothetical protein